MDFLPFCTILLSAVSIGKAGLSIPFASYGNQANKCEWEGQKLPTQIQTEFSSSAKFYVCHFHAEAKTWVLVPFLCLHDLKFDFSSQRCVKSIKSVQKFPQKEFLENNVLLQIPDGTYFSPHNLHLHQREDDAGDENEEQSTSRNNVDSIPSNDNHCRETYQTLTSIINTLTRTIVKLSESRSFSKHSNQPLTSNNSVSINFPLSFISDRLPMGDKQQVTSVEPGQIQSHKEKDTAPSTISINSILAPPKELAPFNAVQKRNSTHHKPTLTNQDHGIWKAKQEQMKLKPGLEQAQSKPEHEQSALKPGNNLFDFLFKNIFRTHPPPMSLQVNNDTRNGQFHNNPPGYGFYKPLPFRPKLPPFQPLKFSSPSPSLLPWNSDEPVMKLEEPKLPANFVNLASFLDQLGNSAEDDPSSEGDGDGMIVRFRSTPSPPILATPLPVPSIPSNSTIYNTISNTEERRMPPLVDIFKGIDDETEDGDDEDSAQMPNNRKPRAKRV